MRYISPLRVPSNTIRRRCAAPLDMGEGNIAILGIHGYTGYPGELAYMAKGLAAKGFHVVVPRLPGHGTSGTDFARTGYRDWLNRVIEAYIELASTHDKVYIMGHSMGGALSLILASIFPVQRMVLFAPAVNIKIPRARFFPILKRIIKDPKSIAWEADPDMIFHDDRDPYDDQYLGSQYWSWARVPQLAELAIVMKLARNKKRLSHVAAASLIITGEHDAAVSRESTLVLDSRLMIPPQRMHCENSGHVIPYDKDRAAVLEATIDFFSIPGVMQKRP